MPREYCAICERELNDMIIQLDDGKKVCPGCNIQLDQVKYMDLSVPETIVWAGKVAKMGKDADGSQRTVIVIPKSQRLFFDKAKYSFIARKLK